MNYWIFKCNPQRFRIDERLQDPEPGTNWRVTRYRDQIMPGDLAFIWRTGPDGGICAVMRVESRPQVLAEEKPDVEYWVDRSEAKPQVRVRGSFTHRIPCLQRDDLRTISGLEALSVFQGWQQATNFRVTQEEGAILLKLVDSAGAVAEVPDYSSAIRRAIGQLHGKDAVIEFFVAFSRFEYGLVQAGYVRDDRRDAQADWDRLAREFNERFDPNVAPGLQQAVTYLLAHPPRKQIYVNGHLEWSMAAPPQTDPLLQRLLVFVRRVRNNLFHGDKLNDLLERYSERNLDLIRSALTVLYVCVDLDDEVQTNFCRGLL
jgi:hypothetical protein